jgi:hypothetical protein
LVQPFLFLRVVGLGLQQINGVLLLVGYIETLSKNARQQQYTKALAAPTSRGHGAEQPGALPTVD